MLPAGGHTGDVTNMLLQLQGCNGRRLALVPCAKLVHFWGRWFLAQTTFYEKNDYLFRESEGKFAFFVMRYFCELHDLENFEIFFFCISHPTHSLECLHLGEETRWSAFSWARKGCKTQRGSSLKNKPARKFSLANIYQREGNERVCCTGNIEITILSSSIGK